MFRIVKRIARTFLARASENTHAEGDVPAWCVPPIHVYTWTSNVISLSFSRLVCHDLQGNCISMHLPAPGNFATDVILNCAPPFFLPLAPRIAIVRIIYQFPACTSLSLVLDVQFNFIESYIFPFSKFQAF